MSENCESEEICSSWYKQCQQLQSDLADARNAIASLKGVIAKHRDTIYMLNMELERRGIDILEGCTDE